VDKVRGKKEGSMESSAMGWPRGKRDGLGSAQRGFGVELGEDPGERGSSKVARHPGLI
jgi:hypothetical protein